MIEKITEDELGKIQELDYEIQELTQEIDMNKFQKLCQIHGKTAVLGLLYKQYEKEYGGPLRAMSMIRHSPFYDESSF